MAYADVIFEKQILLPLSFFCKGAYDLPNLFALSALFAFFALCCLFALHDYPLFMITHLDSEFQRHPAVRHKIQSLLHTASSSMFRPTSTLFFAFDPTCVNRIQNTQCRSTTLFPTHRTQQMPELDATTKTLLVNPVLALAVTRFPTHRMTTCWIH
jgi:hypothetical protein